MKAINKIITNMRHTAPSLTGRVCAGLLFAGLALTSCSDYFDPSPKGIMDADDSFSEGNQTYKGMLGVINAVQQAGDHAIFLTDTRMNVLETTPNAPAALQSIYKYDDTDQNEYADPTCYYRVIIACNDYIKKMERLHATPGALSVTDQSFFKPLLSSAIRFKVWAYIQLGRIYGEAYWFDDALDEQVSLNDLSVFEHCDMEALSAKCLALLESGITVDGVSVPATLNMNWYQWFDSENQDQATYSKWQYLTPPFILLKAELLSWKCNYETDEEAKQDWLWIRNNLLQYIAPRDLKAFGLIPEIIGRLPIVSYLHPLDKEAMRNILTEPKNAITKQYIKLFEMDGVTLRFEDDMLDYVVDKAMENKLGARGLRGLMEEVMMELMYTIPSDKDRHEVVVTREYAQERIEKTDFSRLKNTEEI